VRIGPDRAPRQPDFALAQLAPCLGYRPADADAGAAAAALLQAGGAAPSELPALFGTRVSTATAAASTTAAAAAAAAAATAAAPPPPSPPPPPPPPPASALARHFVFSEAAGTIDLPYSP